MWGRGTFRGCRGTWVAATPWGPARYTGSAAWSLEADHQQSSIAAPMPSPHLRPSEEIIRHGSEQVSCASPTFERLRGARRCWARIGQLVRCRLGGLQRSGQCSRGERSTWDVRACGVASFRPSMRGIWRSPSAGIATTSTTSPSRCTGVRPGSSRPTAAAPQYARTRTMSLRPGSWQPRRSLSSKRRSITLWRFGFLLLKYCRPRQCRGVERAAACYVEGFGGGE